MINLDMHIFVFYEVNPPGVPKHRELTHSYHMGEKISHFLRLHYSSAVQVDSLRILHV